MHQNLPFLSSKIEKKILARGIATSPHPSPDGEGHFLLTLHPLVYSAPA